MMARTSGSTQQKWAEFEAILRAHHAIATTQRIARGREYHYIDLNAGPGIYPLDHRDVPGGQGTPLIAWRVIGPAGRYHLAELDSADRASLQGCVGWATIWDSNQRMLSEMPGHDLVGVVVADPNGCEVPCDELCSFIRRTASPQLDVLLYLSGTAFKRAHRCIDNAVIQQVPKMHWAVHVPHCPQWDRAWFLGSNWEHLTNRFRDMFPVDSTNGAAIMRQLNLTRTAHPCTWDQELEIGRQLELSL